ncbi:Non-catalytic module family DOC2, partial [Piromyces sp. E2]
SQTCWSALLGYSCCNNPTKLYKDESGIWSVENDSWCGVEFCPRCSEVEVESLDKYGYKCCTKPDTLYKDKNGLWSIEDGKWCGIE